MALYAAAFVNYSIPLGLGHVGFGFQRDETTWYWGALEMAGMIKASYRDADFFSWISGGSKQQSRDANAYNGTVLNQGNAQDMVSSMRNGSSNSGEMRHYAYHDMKTFPVPRPNFSAALAVVDRVRKGGYGLVGNNCLDASYNVLKAYANDGNIVPWPLTNPIPRLWFSAIKGNLMNIQSEKATGDWTTQHFGT